MKRALAVLLLAGLGACTNPEVPAGHEGYVYHKPLWFGKMEFREALTGPASTGVSWRLFVINIDMRARSYTEKFQLLTQDNLMVSFEVNTRIQPRSGQVRAIVEEWGADHWYDHNVKEPLRTIVRDQVSKHSATVIQIDTPKVKASIERELHRVYDSSPFEVLSVDIGEIQFPKEVADAIQRKIAMFEELKRQEFVLDKARKEAAIRVLEALRVAKQQRIISSTLDPLYVQREAVEVYRKLATSKNKTIVVLPTTSQGTGLPLVSTGVHRKVLSAADEKLLAEMEAKYMAIAKQPAPPLDDKGAAPTPPAPTPPAPTPPAPTPPAPTPSAPTGP
jgi:regulator of protease activity HflC (stomatin/prohibitin superfamily)